MTEKEKLYDFLSQHITDERKKLFEQIAPNRTRYVTVILEDLFQPHNASAVMRSCDCFGVQDLHIIENKNKFAPNKEIDMGSSKWINLIRYNKTANNTTECINTLKEKGYKIVATTPHANDCNLEALALDQPIALMFGTEKSGLTKTALDLADAYVKIPMYGFTESFNISVSAALGLYSTTERIRQNEEIDWRLNEEEILDLKIEWSKRTLRSAKQLVNRFNEINR